MKEMIAVIIILVGTALIVFGFTSDTLIFNLLGGCIFGHGLAKLILKI